jgi:hypothetical protein
MYVEYVSLTALESVILLWYPSAHSAYIHPDLPLTYRSF